MKCTFNLTVLGWQNKVQCHTDIGERNMKLEVVNSQLFYLSYLHLYIYIQGIQINTTSCYTETHSVSFCIWFPFLDLEQEKCVELFICCSELCQFYSQGLLSFSWYKCQGYKMIQIFSSQVFYFVWSLVLVLEQGNCVFKKYFLCSAGLALKVS